MTAIRTQLVAAIQARLAPLLKTNGNYAAFIGTSPKALRDDNEDDMDLVADLLQGQAPAILVYLGKRQPTQFTVDGVQQNFTDIHDISIYLISNNAISRSDGRMQSATALEAGDDPGIHAMMRDAELLLVGFAPLITDGDSTDEAHQLKPTNEDYVYADLEMTVWEQSYTLAIDRDLAAVARSASVQILATTIASSYGLENLDPPFMPIIQTITVLP